MEETNQWCSSSYKRKKNEIINKRFVKGYYMLPNFIVIA